MDRTEQAQATLEQTIKLIERRKTMCLNQYRLGHFIKF